jgi:hypothetical protein
MGKRDGLRSKSLRNYCAWSAVCLKVAYPIIIIENAKEFIKFVKPAVLDIFGCDYVPSYTILDPRMFSWPVRRVRFYGVLIHKSIVSHGEVPRPMAQFDLLSVVSVFMRLCGVSYHCLLEDTTAEEIEQELSWMKNRKKSRTKDLPLVQVLAGPQPFLASLTDNEQKRWLEYVKQNSTHGMCHCLGQNPERPQPNRGISSTLSDMYTMMRKANVHMINYDRVAHRPIPGVRWPGYA